MTEQSSPYGLAMSGDTLLWSGLRERYPGSDEGGRQDTMGDAIQDGWLLTCKGG